MTVLKSKRVSYGTVELVETDHAGGLRYYISVDGRIKEQSNDRSYLEDLYENRYY